MSLSKQLFKSCFGPGRVSPSLQQNSSKRKFLFKSKSLLNQDAELFNPRIAGFVQKPFYIPSRSLSLHEYLSQDLMKSYGIEVPVSKAAHTPDEAEAVARSIGGLDWMVKAQILAGGRGKGHFTNGFKGGIHIADSPEQASKIASKMLGQNLITAQTGELGRPVNTVLVTERFYIRRETYLAILMDRVSNGPTIVACANGGVDIEQSAENDPNSIIRIPIDIRVGITDEQAEAVTEKLGFNRNSQLFEKTRSQVKLLYKLFIEKDATLLEINPLVETSDGRMVCLDAKINFDDNALFRHTDLASKRDWTQEDPREMMASRHDLNYIGLDGNIACLVNGAGLAMATMDIIKLYGGEPANFLDVGGGASERQVTEAFKILNEDSKVQTILVNIFGGIMRCDVIASGIINAAQEVNIKKSIIVRLQGTNVDRAKQLINSCGIRIISAEDLDQAADQSVNIARIRELASKVNLDVSFELPI